MDSILEMRNVRYAYSSMPDALRGVSLSIQRGAKIALVGPNGAGKTTLLLMCNGTLRPVSGEVVLNGSPLRYDTRSLRKVRKTVGLVFQNSDMQLFAPTVFQDIAFGPFNLGIEGEELADIVDRVLHAVGLNGYERRPPHHLSSGEKKRVAIAGILAMEPELLVFDEPTSALDPAGAEEIVDLLDELNHEGKTILLSTHDVELAYRWADEVVFMHEGRILASGTPEAVFSNGDLLTKARLKPPLVVDLFSQLVQRGLFEKTRAPAGMIDFLTRVENRIGKKPRGCTIHLCDADRMNGRMIRELVSAYGITCIGAMGTRAKRLAASDGIDLDISYSVIDRSILRALAGERPLVLTSGGMLFHTQKRVQRYREESGIPISIECIRSGISGTRE